MTHSQQESYDDALRAAYARHTQGDLPGAEILCRQVLLRMPHNGDALYLLGIIAFQTQHLAAAAELLQSAVLTPPPNPHRFNSLGVVLLSLGRAEEAIGAFRQGLALNPNIAELHSNLGRGLDLAGHAATAELHLRRALELQPNFPEACINLANTLKGQSNLPEAEAMYRRALGAKPDYAKAAYNLGLLLKEQNRLNEALEFCHLATQLAPSFADAHNNLGVVLRSLNRISEAQACFTRAIELDPQYMEALANLGNVHDAAGNADAALSYIDRAVALAPEHPELRLNQAYALLKTGNYREGWRAHEWRWKTNMFRAAMPNYPQPLWDGSNLDGRSILLWSEQGLGDTLQFIRYAPLVSARGGRVIALCQPALKTLLLSCMGIEAVIGNGEPLPTFDVHCPLMSLPLMLATEIATIPAATPYLHADAVKSSDWRMRIDQFAENKLKIGLVWAGSPRKELVDANIVDARRSIRLDAFLPILNIPGSVFFSLQKGEAARQIGELPATSRPLDFSEEWTDFSDTAGFVANMDLIIAVDTSVAHLAGALGRPVWLLSRSDGCWRWLLERSDSPWYPTLRIFRQTTPGDWTPVIAEVAEALREKLEHLDN